MKCILPEWMLFIFSSCVLADASMPSVPYCWKNVAIGGGGYVTGIVMHPSEKDLLYIRTDVGGAYRWDAQQDYMIALTDWIGFEESNWFGVDGMALAPSNPDLVYLVCGKDPQAGPHAVLKSCDRGMTWSRTALDKPAGGNKNLRWAGECIAVDPYNENLVYCGTRYDGLWKTMDGGDSWVRVEGVPCGSEGNGIRTLLFDSSGSETATHSTLYAGVYDRGVYRSMDGGATWNLCEGGPSQPQRMAVDGTGVLYVASSDGVYRYGRDGWRSISPETHREYSSISVDPFDANRLLCAERSRGFNNPIYLSQDGGNTWCNLIENDRRHFQVPWWPKRYFSAANACTIFDPHHRHRVWFSDWFGTWSCPDISAPIRHWYTHEKGHEEMVVFGMISPSVGARLLTGIADNNGMRHTQFEEFPAKRFGEPSVQSTTGLDFCESDPNVIARVGSTNTGSGGVGAYSIDNGETWSAFGDTSFAMNGRIAVSATDPKRLVVLPIGDTPKYSTDAGATWHESSGAAAGGVGNFWHKAHPFASDRVNGNRFYYFEGGDVYRSEDGGKTWRATASLPRDIKGFLTTMVTAPTLEGEVWISLGYNGLFRSSDAGETFNRVKNVSWSHLVAFGKAAPGREVPTVFVYGTIRGVQGIFRSIDWGESWVRIHEDRYPIGNSPECMTGDRQVFGCVYIGTNGRGVFVGEPDGNHAR